MTTGGSKGASVVNVSVEVAHALPEVGLLAALAAVHLGLDALETWYAIKAPAWIDTHAAEALWYLPFFATLIIARARRYELGDAQRPAKTEPAQEPGELLGVVGAVEQDAGLDLLEATPIEPRGHEDRRPIRLRRGLRGDLALDLRHRRLLGGHHQEASKTPRGIELHLGHPGEERAGVRPAHATADVRRD